MATNDGGPAFPMPVGQAQDGAHSWNSSNEGMTLRDYFAAVAMQGVSDEVCRMSPTAMEGFACACYQMADAMLAARDKK